MQTELHDSGKKFGISPATDPITPIILEARMRCLRAPKLRVAYGAKALFCLLLDLSLDSFRNAGRRGVVDISIPRLCEALDCSRGVLLGGRRSEDGKPGWIAQLVRAGFVWTNYAGIPGRWDINRYHILALDDPKHPQQVATRDGIYGNGHRRGHAPDLGFENRGGVNIIERGDGSDIAKNSQNERDTPQNLDGSGPDNATRHVMENGTRHVAENRTRHVQKTERGASTKPDATRPQNGTHPVQKPQHLRETEGLEQSPKGGSKPLRVGSKVSRTQVLRENAFIEQMVREIDKFSGPKKASFDSLEFGDQWRMSYREDPDRAVRAFQDVKDMIKHGEPMKGVGEAWRYRWNEFASRKAVAK